jgi:hypothetical protein
MSAAELWSRLQAAGIVEGDPPAADRARQPWYVRAMLIFSGWLGAIFLFGFIATLIAFAVQSPIGSLTIGLGILAGSRLIFRLPGTGDFTGQFGLAAAFAGQALCIYGLSELFKGERVDFWLVLAAFEIALVVLLPNFLHRIACTLAAALALGMALEKLGVLFAGTAIVAACCSAVWLSQSTWGKRIAVWEAVGIGLAVALTAWDVHMLVGELSHHRAHYASSGLTLHIGRVLLGAVALGAVAKLLMRDGANLASGRAMAALGGTALLAVASWEAPGLLPGLLVTLLGFASGARFLVGLGVAGMIGFLSWYYYSLNTTLLVKSGVLAATGAVLLLAHLILRRIAAREVEGEHHA